MSEFSGAGAGGLLISALLKRALDRGLTSVFAVTVSDDAAAFFLHRGFTEVSRDDVPPGKWTGYHPERLARARCVVAEAEVALALRDFAPAPQRLEDAAQALAARGDRANARHAQLIALRRRCSWITRAVVEVEHTENELLRYAVTTEHDRLEVEGDWVVP